MAYGVKGGKEGTPSELHLHRSTGEHLRLPGRATFTMYKGDILKSITAAGGGWGNPLERDPERMLEDVINEKFTIDYVRKEYGVVIDKETMTLDIDATRKLRQQMMQGRT
jgi:N-methylhydantoinase B